MKFRMHVFIGLQSRINSKLPTRKKMVSPLCTLRIKTQNVYSASDFSKSAVKKTYTSYGE